MSLRHQSTVEACRSLQPALLDDTGFIFHNDVTEKQCIVFSLSGQRYFSLFGAEAE
jgi:hypothetical protein